MDDASRPLAVHGWDRVPAVATALTADRRRYLARRRVARVLTLAVVVHQGVLLADVVARGGAAEPTRHASAALGLVVLVVTSVALAALLWWAWQRVAAVRPVVLPLDATVGEAVGIPELDPSARAHLSLTGQVDVPRRW